MEELFELKKYIESGDYPAALNLIEEMEEMSRDDKINKIGSFVEILLIHLIKQHAEQRSTRSWEISIRNAVENLEDVNQRRKSGGYYLAPEELAEVIENRYNRALRRASLEIFEGKYDDKELAEMVDVRDIIEQALNLLIAFQKR